MGCLKYLHLLHADKNFIFIIFFNKKGNETRNLYLLQILKSLTELR